MDLKDLMDSLMSSDTFTRNSGLGALDPASSFLSNHTTLDILSGDNVYLFAGPPLESQAAAFPQYLLPVGTCTVMAQQNVRQWLPVSEFGNQYMYHVPNKMQFSMSVSKILSAKGDIYRTFAEWMMHHWNDLHYGDAQYDISGMHWQERPNALKGTKENVVGETQIVNPGSEYTLMPFGILQVEYTTDFRVARTAYCENCKLAAVARTKSASSPMNEENGQILISRVTSTNIQVAFKEKTPFNIADPDESANVGGAPLSSITTGGFGGGAATTQLGLDQVT